MPANHPHDSHNAITETDSIDNGRSNSADIDIMDIPTDNGSGINASQKCGDSIVNISDCSAKMPSKEECTIVSDKIIQAIRQSDIQIDAKDCDMPICKISPPQTSTSGIDEGIRLPANAGLRPENGAGGGDIGGAEDGIGQSDREYIAIWGSPSP